MHTHAQLSASPKPKTPLHAPPNLSAILRGTGIHPKLRVGAVDDPAEAEADRIADHVMRMPEAGTYTMPLAAALAGVDPILRRKCAACEEEDHLHRKAHSPASATGGILTSTAESAIKNLGPGTPLPASERAFFEPRFGQDLGHVRVHDNAVADAAAKSINARAFVLGNDVAFGAGEFRPGTSEGRRLVAHELGHVFSRTDTEVRRATTRGAGGCAPISSVDEDVDGPRQAGLIAHNQLQGALLLSNGIRSELPIPRATKRNLGSTACQPSGVAEGRADLFTLGPTSVLLGEIKPIGSAHSLAAEEVEHYLLRAQQTEDRVTSTGQCGSMTHTVGEDDVFDRRVRSFRRGMAPPAFGKLNGIWSAPTTIGPFDGDRSKTLRAEMVAPGAVGYWCTGGDSQTLECGDPSAFDQYIETVLYSVQGEVDKYLVETYIGPLDEALKDLDVRKLLKLGRQWGGQHIRQAIADFLGVPLATVPNLTDEVIEQIAILIDQQLTGPARNLIATLAARIKNIILSHLRTAIKAAIRSWIREIMVVVCVASPAITLSLLIEELKKRLKQQMPQLVLAALALAVVELASLIATEIQSVLSAVTDVLLIILKVLAMVVLAIAIVVVTVLLIIAIADLIPGDEVIVAAIDAFLISLLRQLALSLAAAPAVVPVVAPVLKPIFVN
jgi:Domain of unknown function (DUF4157)